MKFTAHLRHQFLAARVSMTFAGVIACMGLVTVVPANAASMYVSSATAVLSLSTTGSLDDLAYLGSEVGYSAHAEAISNGVKDREAITQPLFKSGTFGSFGSNFASGKGLEELLMAFSSGARPLYPEVEAMVGGAKSKGDIDTGPSGGNGGRFSVSADGVATDPVESADSRSRLDVFVAFQNTSNSVLEIEWSLTYGLHNEAIADPRGSAFAESRVRAARGTFENGDPVFEDNIFEKVAGACGFNHPFCADLGETPADPPSLEMLFKQILEPGESQFFNFELVAAGNAIVVPVPAALPLFGTGLALMGLLGWRNRRKAPAV